MKRSRPITREEVKALLSVAKDAREAALVLVGVSFGLRISEALQLRFSDFVNGEIEIRSLKGGKPRRLAVSRQAHAAIDNLREFYEAKKWIISDDSYLFLSQKRCQMTSRHAARIFKDICGRAGLKGTVSYHGLRKLYATTIYRETCHNLFETQKYTGHKSAASLAHYIATSTTLALTGEIDWTA